MKCYFGISNFLEEISSLTLGLYFIRTLLSDPSFLVALRGMAHSFIELHKPLCHDKAVIHKGEILPYVSLKDKDFGGGII